MPSYQRQLFILLGIVFAALLGIGAIWYGTSAPNPGNAATTHVSIAEGSSVAEIGRVLHDAGVIRNATLFTAYARFSGKSRLLQAGTYVMPLDISLRDVLERLVSGEGNQNDIQVTIPEGFNSAQVYEAMEAAGLSFEKSDFDQVVAGGFVGHADQIIYAGKPAEAPLIGYLFPDTYKFYADSTAEQAVEKMVANFSEKITNEMRAQIGASEYSFYELLTLASIVEKEVRTAEERRIAAGIFLQRLADTYPLQSDATLNFITGKKETRASASDLTINSPYNSYARVGLPPTPISNPGIDSIKAVLDPVQSDYYFFLTTPEGEAIFSRTLDEHNQQKAIYYP